MKFLNQNKKALSYSLIMGLAFLFLNRVIHTGSKQEMFIGIIVCLIIFSFEVYTILASAKTKLEQLGIPAVKRYSGEKELIYHKLLPLLSFLSFFSFIYFNRIDDSLYLILLIIVFLYFVLFVNIRSYYEDKFNQENLTHFIYSLISIFAVFSFTNSILNLTNIHDAPPLFTGFAIFLVVFCLIFVSLIDSIIEQILVIPFLLFISVVSSLSVLILFIELDSTIRSSFISSLCTYFGIAIIHHKAEGTLNRNLLLEYFSILILSLILFIGLG